MQKKIKVQIIEIDGEETNYTMNLIENWTVDDLKYNLNVLDTTLGYMDLIHDGVVMEDNKKVSEYNIKDDDIICKIREERPSEDLIDDDEEMLDSAEIYREKAEHLINLGYSREDVFQAFQAANYDYMKAINMLAHKIRQKINGDPEEEEDYKEKEEDEEDDDDAISQESLKESMMALNLDGTIDYDQLINRLNSI